MGVMQRLFGQKPQPALALYNAVVARGREPHWYLDGAVPDKVDGRFDMIAAVLAMVLLRLETEAAGATLSAQVTERFVDDMDGQLREIGIGDIVVGKHIGRMMAMLGGRLGAYRDGVAAGDLGPALIRNLYRGAAPDPLAVAHVSTHLMDLREKLAGVSVARLTNGDLP
ncbi:ubiquinol-cytochrome C chaperone family protein [uncultured Sphingomonas sp.]|uniref:ubiquinol-cytochrome C chaperone family protein n=1 Tax=uncultured Sphingomonas sp. TaxID=158754 RepID=UPI0026038C1C|nr:ubiquinol-cytochrome C chaperone family protein [uncultured Sphingomonas sp.]